MTDRLQGLAKWEAVFEAPGFDVGGWAPSGSRGASDAQMPWFAYSPEIDRFVEEMYALGWVREFDWMSWAGSPAGRRLHADPTLVGAANEEDLSRLLTTIIRRERFSDGEIASALETGMLTAIARRAGSLVTEATSSDSATEGLPFLRYDGGGRKRLGRPQQGNATARSGYGPPVFVQCGYRCVYCALDMSATFENWLQLSVDHVVPRQMSGRGFDPDLVEDITNQVTCCRACNDFGNRFTVADPPPTSDEAFYGLRDRTFPGAKGHDPDQARGRTCNLPEAPGCRT